MAIIGTNLTSGGDVTAGTSSVTSSFTPSPMKLILAAVVNGPGTGPNSPTVTGCGLTWVQVLAGNYVTGGSSIRRLTVLRAMSVSPNTGIVTIDYAAQSQNEIWWCVDEFSGVDTSGSNGANAIVQSVFTELAVAGTSITVTLAPFSNINNGTYGAFGSSGSNGATVGSGYNLLATVGLDTNNFTILTEWRNDNDTTVDYSQTNSHKMGGIGIELKEESDRSFRVNNLRPRVFAPGIAR
jgi:hypothetical protein